MALFKEIGNRIKEARAKNMKENKDFLKGYTIEETETTFIAKDNKGEEFINIRFNPINDTWKIKAFLVDKTLEREIKAPLDVKQIIISETLKELREIRDIELSIFLCSKYILILLVISCIIPLLQIINYSFNFPGNFALGIMKTILSFAFFMFGMEFKEYLYIVGSILWLLSAISSWF